MRDHKCYEHTYLAGYDECDLAVYYCGRCNRQQRIWKDYQIRQLMEEEYA